MKRTRVFPLLLALVLGLMTGCGKKEVEVEEDIVKPVVVKALSKEDRANTIEISGNVKPKQLYKIAFKVPGLIESEFVEEGSKVEAGAPLMSLNSYDYEIAVNAARAQRDTVQHELDSKLRSAEEQAKSTLDYVNEQLEKVRRLEEKGAVSKKTLDELELQQVVVENKYREVLDAKETAIFQLEQAQSMLDLAQSKHNDTTISSPVAGTVIKKRVEIGETAIPGNPAVVIANLDHLEVEMGVPDRHIQKISLGQAVEVEIKGLEKTIKGTISNIEETADLETRTFPVKVDIANSDRDIKPGMIANVKVETDRVSNITVPTDVVMDDSEGSVVFVYDEEAGTCHKRSVVVGQIYNDEIEITEGLEEGDQLVIEGHYRLNDGEKVQVRRVEEDD